MKRKYRRIIILSILWIPLLALIVFMGIDTGFDAVFFTSALLFICMFGFISVLFGFLLTDSAESVFTGWPKPQESLRERLTMFLMPGSVILLGAIVTRLIGHLAVVSIVTIIMSMTTVALISLYRRRRSKRLPEEEEEPALIIQIGTLVFPFTVTYFIFLFFVCGFDINKLKNLF